MSQPHRAHPRGRDEHPGLASFIAGAYLAVRGLFEGVSHYPRLGGLVDAVLHIGLAATSVKQRLDPARFHRRLVAVESVARQAHHLAGLGDIAQFGREIEQAEFVFDNVLVKALHGVTFRLFVSIVGSHLYQNR
jgi:hypothetical protein